jgi:hypothetical protein
LIYRKSDRREDFVLILFTIILYFAVHGLLSYPKNPLHKGLALSAIISVILACGITYPLFEPIFTYLFDHVFIFKGMRDSQKFIAVLVLAYSFLESAGIDELVSGLKTNKRISSLSKNRKKIFSISLAALILAVPLIYTFTIFNGFHGQIVPKDYPQEWYEVNDFLNNDTEDYDVLFLLMDNKELAVFKNQYNTSRIREVTSLIEITHWNELIDKSRTIDINDYGFILTSNDTTNNEPYSSTTPAKPLNYTATSPFKYQIHDHINNNKYIIFTSLDHDHNGWLLSNSKSHDSPGLTSIFIPSGSAGNDTNIYFKPLYSHIIGSLISLAAISLI